VSAGLVAVAWLAIGAPAGRSDITPFSSGAPGPGLPPGWERLGLPDIRPPDFALVDDGGTTVLRVASADAAGSAAYRLAADAARTPMLSWRWKVDRVVAGADLARKEGDDFAARLYVTFDVPASSLPLAERARIRLARLVHGTELPTAAICYVWDNRHPVGTSAWNPYSSRVRMVVLRSGAAEAGRWARESRDVAADFRAAFGTEPPAITGVAVSADTDQTHERVTAWFGDLRLEARP
jgi:hypothetical protein